MAPSCSVRETPRKVLRERSRLNPFRVEFAPAEGRERLNRRESTTLQNDESLSFARGIPVIFDALETDNVTTIQRYVNKRIPFLSHLRWTLDLGDR